MEVVLVSNGPGELYTWVYPVLKAFREAKPDWRVVISLIPCQFASGREAEIASTFGADAVTSVKDYISFSSLGKKPEAFMGSEGLVISLGGNQNMAVTLAKKLAYKSYSYKFVPAWNKHLSKLFVHNNYSFAQAKRKKVPEEKLELVGNLVADVVGSVVPAVGVGSPHIVLMAGTRDGFSLFLIPFIIGVADYLIRVFPEASFVWPVSRLISEDTIQKGILGQEKAVMSGMSGGREVNTVLTPSGARIEMIEEHERHAHMRAADLAVTIPGTNTLELGIAGLPSIVVLPMNKPEAIPLEGIGHWLGLIPLIGKYLKRYAVKVFVEGLDLPVSLPNRDSKENIMLELKGSITAEQVANEAIALLNAPEVLAHKRERLLATMPKAGAARALVASILKDL